MSRTLDLGWENFASYVGRVIAQDGWQTGNEIVAAIEENMFDNVGPDLGQMDLLKVDEAGVLKSMPYVRRGENNS